MPSPFALSMLDLAPVPEGVAITDVLARTVELAELGEALGFERVWYAEHHGMPTIASSSPDILIANTAAKTKSIRVGSGGVMLPNHVPLRVAETYRTLAALHPGRIDLGIGRAGGSDGRTLNALRSFGGEQFPEHFSELLAFDRGQFPDGHPFASVKVVPDEVTLPPIWLLGSSGASAQSAGSLGLGYAFAAHFSQTPAAPIFAAYRAAFQPSDEFSAPHAILCLQVICAPTNAEAGRLSRSLELMWALMHSNARAKIASVETAEAYPYTAQDRAVIAQNRPLWIIGDPPTVKAEIDARIEATGANEVMITTTVYGHADRLRSYQLLAEAYGLKAER